MEKYDGAQEPMAGAGKTTKSGLQQKGALAEVKADAAKEQKKEDAAEAQRNDEEDERGDE